MRTRAEPLGIEVVVGDPEADVTTSREPTFGALVPVPHELDGRVLDYEPFTIASRQEAGAKAIVVATDPAGA